MQLGIIGLARSGKTTVFNAVTRGSAQVGAYSSSSQPNVGVVNVPDARVDRLAEMYHPKKTTYATIQYVDFPAAGESFGKGEGPAGKFVNDLARTDALIHVVRAFEDDSVPHPEVTIDADRDIATMDLELSFVDLAIIERRLQRLETEMRSVKAGERDQMQRLKDLLARLKAALESEQPIRELGLSDEDRKLLEGSQFLSAQAHRTRGRVAGKVPQAREGCGGVLRQVRNGLERAQRRRGGGIPSFGGGDRKRDGGRHPDELRTAGADQLPHRGPGRMPRLDSGSGLDRADRGGEDPQRSPTGLYPG
jgi:hypothetical protein